MEEVKRKRELGIDVIKVVALLSVISVHFFSYIGFYDQPIYGKGMLILTTIRNFFMICVPLFLLATGYLMNRKKFDKKYYKGIVRVLYVYVIVSIICIIYSKIKGDQSSIWHMVLSIFSFSAAGYSWYVEMYIGLFLIIPFLNLIYNNLENKKDKMILIFTMLFLTAIPDVINIYNFENLNFWKNPAGIGSNLLLPKYWTSLYPISYYFIGAFISEYKPKMNKKLNLLLIIVTTIFIGIFNFWYSFGKSFVWGSYQNYSSLFVVILSCLCFNLLINIDYSGWNNKIKKIIEIASSATLGAYLISEVFDKIIYSKLNESIVELKYKVIFYVIIVPVIFILSVLISTLINKSYTLIKNKDSKRV